MSKRNSSFLSAFFIAISGLAGCSGDPMQKAEVYDTVSASGTATFKGQPLEFYQVNFIPEGGKRTASGMVDAQGKFVLGTNEVGDGAIAGTGKVSVVYVGPPSTVEPGREEPGTKVPAPKVKIPAKYSDPAKSGLSLTIPEGGSSELKIDLQE